jgi:hypothetical protein
MKNRNFAGGNTLSTSTPFLMLTLQGFFSVGAHSFVKLIFAERIIEKPIKKKWRNCQLTLKEKKGLA